MQTLVSILTKVCVPFVTTDQKQVNLKDVTYATYMSYITYITHVSYLNPQYDPFLTLSTFLRKLDQTNTIW